MKIKQIQALRSFRCLEADCPDTCCRGWDMPVDDASLAKIKKQKPELMDSVENGIMKKNACGECVKLQSGICGTHKEHGADYLGDVCNFYPRITRKLGDKTVMSATLSCPETARLMLFGVGGASLRDAEVSRLPSEIKDYLPEGITSGDALRIHNAYLMACVDSSPAERIMTRVMTVTKSLKLIKKSDWAGAIDFYFKTAEQRLPKADVDIYDTYRVLHSLAGLMYASKRKTSPKLKAVFETMEKALGIQIDWEKLAVMSEDTSHTALLELLQMWQKRKDEQDVVLRRYINAQISSSLFPFAGFGEDISQRITILCARFATVRLALMSYMGLEKRKLEQKEIINIIQPLSRFMDHLSDPKLSMSIYKEAGWVGQPRLRGMLLD